MKFSSENDTNYGALKSVIEKDSRLEKGVVICTRLISLIAIGAGKKCELKMGSVRTICLSKCPDRTGKGRGVIGLASNSNHAPPGQAYPRVNSFKTMGGWLCVMDKIAITSMYANDPQYRQEHLLLPYRANSSPNSLSGRDISCW